ncbi:hypothetical protein DEI94_12215 [Curtobacterium sp. MCBD17_040]|nr:hypothetical protein [Curtobacterium sp. MCBD17_040]WIB65185.1 hypothetical protein DEI94_12215 [Curtobacterium sp. MCBD17_040]
MTGALVLAAATSPTTPASTVPDVDVTPGVWGFVVIAIVAVATIALVVDMTRRIRRTRYRSEIRERLEAEARGELPGEDADGLGDLDGRGGQDDRRGPGGCGDVRGTGDAGRADVGDDTERG